MTRMVGTTGLGVSPSSMRIRSLLVTKVGDVNNLSIGYKNTYGDFGEFSCSKSNSRIKIPWGTPVKCEFVLARDGEETIGEFKFTSKRRSEEKFKASLLNSLEGGVNPFSKRIAAMIVNNHEELLSMYLSLLLHTVGFSMHREEIHSVQGILMDGEGFDKR